MNRPDYPTPVDPRIEAAARAIYTADQQDGDEQCWDTDTDAIRDTYVRLAKAAAEALGVAPITPSRRSSTRGRALSSWPTAPTTTGTCDGYEPIEEKS